MTTTHKALSIINHQSSKTAPTTEWSITMLFYAAVHAADHVLFNGVDAPQRDYDHYRRESMMWNDKKLRTVRQQYLQLKTLSTKSRYMPAYHPMHVNEMNHALRLAEHILKLAGISLPAAIAQIGTGLTGGAGGATAGNSPSIPSTTTGSTTPSTQS